MITSLSWLKNHLTTNANLNQVAERLTQIGLEVENIKSSDSNLDNLRLLMEDALAECNVSEFSPDVGSDYRKLEGVDQNIEIILFIYNLNYCFSSNCFSTAY